MFQKHAAGKNMLFESPILINRFIKAYLKRSESREYLRLLFGKTLDRLAKIEGPVPLPPEPIDGEEVPIRRGATVKGDLDGNYGAVASAPHSAIIEGLHRASTKGVEDVHEDEKQTDAVQFERLTKDCDELLRRLSKCLVYMPLSIRYLCKLCEKLARSCVLSSNNTDV